MIKTNNHEKSQTELIIDNFLKRLQLHSEFDDKSLTKLKEIASSEEFTQYKKIESAISIGEEGENENS